MNRLFRNRSVLLASASGIALAACISPVLAQDASFHGAPAAAQQEKNPYAGQSQSAASGKAIFARSCATCHGPAGAGTGNVPSLANGPVQTASDGAIFWYITKGDVDNGMPSWQAMPQEQRWQAIVYIKSLKSGNAANADVPAAAAAVKSTAPPPKPPFTDYRFEQPGAVRHITLQDLPEPYATESATAGPKIVARPADAWPKAPAGFKVELYATGLHNPRIMRRAPNGDIFLAETSAGDIKVFRGMTADHKPELVQVFATGLNTPFGIAFYPPGPDPHWVYVADMEAVVRFPYHNGDMTSTAPPEHLDDLPSGGHHRSRDINFSPVGKNMYVSVGSM